MTEQEAIKILEIHTNYLIRNWKPYPDEKVLDAIRKACASLEEIQQYRAIGTIEEFKALKEKSVAKKPDYEGDGCWDGHVVIDTWICPSCEKHYEVDYDDYDYCPNCGQRIDHSGLTEDD